MVIDDSVIPTVATASAPSLDTKNMSTTAKTDSIIISKTIGIESMSNALPILSLVKSRSVPDIASFISVHSDCHRMDFSWAKNDIGFLSVMIKMDYSEK